MIKTIRNKNYIQNTFELRKGPLTLFYWKVHGHISFPHKPLFNLKGKVILKTGLFLLQKKMAYSPFSGSDGLIRY